jgi:hypothetical protein
MTSKSQPTIPPGPAAVEAAGPASRSWAFHYSGPLGPIPDFGCVTCLAAKQKKCPAHGQGFALQCAHCTAAQNGDCHGHWGLDRAVEHYAGQICPVGSVVDFRRALELARTEIEQLAPGEQQVTIDLSGSGSGSLVREGSRSFVISIVVR